MDVYRVFILLSIAPVIALAIGVGTLQFIKWVLDKNL